MPATHTSGKEIVTCRVSHAGISVEIVTRDILEVLAVLRHLGFTSSTLQVNAQNAISTLQETLLVTGSDLPKGKGMTSLSTSPITEGKQNGR